MIDPSAPKPSPIRGLHGRFAKAPPRGSAFTDIPPIPVFTISDAAAERSMYPIPWPWLVRAAAWLCGVLLPDRGGFGG